MILKNKDAEVFIPDGKQVVEALKRTTHMSIAAHQDDIEIMSCDGILKCFGMQDKWFTGVVITNGSGSPRDGLYADYSDEKMQQIRKVEQKKAAFIGEYSAQVLMQYSSSEVKEPTNIDLVQELKELIILARPEVIYTHNLADKHDTHVASALKVIKAIREIPAEIRPQKLYGCEVWRNLDWLADEEKVSFDVSSHENISSALMGVFDSQICGGKSYDLATMGRRRSNATFSSSHATDNAEALSYAMDLTELIRNEDYDITEFIKGCINRFAMDVFGRIKGLL